MALTTVLFDLDGTLLPMDQEVFVKDYFARLTAWIAPLGYDPNEFVASMWKGIRAMFKNDGAKFNKDIFESVFTDIYKENAPELFDRMEKFYETEFPKVKATCGFNPKAAKTVIALKEAGYRVILATSPIFPAVGTYQRIAWAGLKPSDFELVTTYENCVHGKPNPAYYKDILKEFNLRPDECIMVGNDVGDDMIAKTLGLDVFLLTDYLINHTDGDISIYPQGGFDELAKHLNITI